MGQHDDQAGSDGEFSPSEVAEMLTQLFTTLEPDGGGHDENWALGALLNVEHYIAYKAGLAATLAKRLKTRTRTKRGGGHYAYINLFGSLAEVAIEVAVIAGAYEAAVRAYRDGATKAELLQAAAAGPREVLARVADRLGLAPQAVQRPASTVGGRGLKGRLAQRRAGKA